MLRLASREGAVSITVHHGGRVVAGAYEQLDLLARLSERGLLRYAGLRGGADRTDIVYEI